MKTSLTVLVLVLLLLSILAGCAPGPNSSRKMASEHGEFAGFWLGLWQGFIAPFVFVVSLFKGDLNVYEVHNNNRRDVRLPPPPVYPPGMWTGNQVPADFSDPAIAENN